MSSLGARVFGALIPLFTLPVIPVEAADRLVEDIRISRTGSEAEVIVQLACPMRFVSEQTAQSGLLLEIHMSRLQSCQDLITPSDLASERYRPPGGHLAHLTEIEYESLGIGSDLLLLRFERPVAYRISQLGDLRLLLVSVDTSDQPNAVEEPSTKTVVVVPPAPQQDTTAEPRSLSSGIRVRTPATVADYIVNLQSTLEPVDPRVIESAALANGGRVYVSETTLDGQTWYRLRLGFFTSEAEAQDAASVLRERFPRAWIGRADSEEMRLAGTSGFFADNTARPESRLDTDESVAAAPLGTGPGSLGPARTAELMVEAREATIDQKLDSAIRIYTRLLQEPGDHRPEARELLGVAREKNGQIAHASAEYRSYLADYPALPGSDRVRQRLNGLMTAAAAPREPLRRSETSTPASWDVSSGVSQYYRRGVSQFEDDRGDVVTLSALMTDVDVSARRTGSRIDLATRLAVSHFYDLLGEEDNGPGDHSRLAYAYFELADEQGGWSARLGRQTLHHWGVLGRFDGAHLGYEWQADRGVHLILGYPVESTRNSVESGRQFQGIAVEFGDLRENWNLSAFVNQQTIGGIDARRAIGTEIRYQDENRSLTGMLDYDVDFGELNTLLALGTWRLRNRMTLSGLLDLRQSPILMTRNALIGQSVSSFDELLLAWTEDEIRQLASDRTAAMQTVTLGLSSPVGERFQLNADLTVTEVDATVASGGVPAVPGTGQQIFYSTSVVGSSLFGTSDVNIFSLRYGVSDEFKTSYASWDARFPIGRRIRLNPRLRLSLWEGILDGRKREVISPSLRFLFNTRNHYRFELEVGRDGYARSDVNGEIESSGYYFNLGYRMNY